MSVAKKLLGALGEEEKQYVDDVFSTYLYTGNGSTQTINNGIDLAGKGGLVWIKFRGGNANNNLTDTARGSGKALYSDNTIGEVTNSAFPSLFSNGFSLATSDVITNGSGGAYASWTFRRAPKFFELLTFTHTNGTAKTIDLSYLGAVGFVTIKRTDSAGDWYAWHRSLTAGNNLKLNTGDAQSTANAYINVSGTTLTFSASAPTGAYVLYGMAQDPGADGLIQCGDYVCDANSRASAILGFEPQLLLVKRKDGGGDWGMYDSFRSLNSNYSAALMLRPNSVGAEANNNDRIRLTASGFEVSDGTSTVNGANQSFIYIAIRRPNKPPTSGTGVFDLALRTGNDVATLIETNAFPPDLYMVRGRSDTLRGNYFLDRLRGAGVTALDSSSTNSESAYATVIDQFNMKGVRSASTAGINRNAFPYIDYWFRRATGFMDVVCDTGTGAAHTVAHNLMVAPELVIRKSRSSAAQWEVWHSALAASEKLVLNSTAAKVTDATAWNSTAPGASSLTVGTGANVNANGATFVTYLWATLAGVSKVGSYTGNGGTQAIDCGFTTGARFILVKRIDAAGDWFVWDTARGIVSGNDPHLSLNTTAAEVTTDDSVDPNPLGFSVNQVAATNINVSGGQYLFLAIS